MPPRFKPVKLPRRKKYARLTPEQKILELLQKKRLGVNSGIKASIEAGLSREQAVAVETYRLRQVKSYSPETQAEKNVAFVYGKKNKPGLPPNARI